MPVSATAANLSRTRASSSSRECLQGRVVWGSGSLEHTARRFSSAKKAVGDYTACKDNCVAAIAKTAHLLAVTSRITPRR